jgi:hypothetical protein
MTSRSHLIFALAGVCLAAPAVAQTHYVKKPETVVRAVGVYEWTGDLAKPTASRLIPVTIFIDGKLEDAGVYLARPVPMALETGTVFELDQAGVPKGMLDLAFARHLQATDSTGSTLYDDGWFGYGTYTGPARPTILANKGKVRQTKAAVQSSIADSSRPHFAGKSPATTGDSSTTTPAADPNRPTMKRADGSSSDSTTSAGNASTPVSDPDRPTLSRRDGSSSSSTTDTTSTGTTAAAAPPASTTDDDPDRPTMIRRSPSNTPDSTSSTGTSNPPDDPDRPTLKKRTPAEQKAARKSADESSVSAVGSLNDDPNRPTIKRGKPAHSLNDDDLPKLVGLPVDLQQMVAVSDAVNRPEHDFARPWESDEERTHTLAQLEDLARAKLKAYQALTQPAPAPTPAKPAAAAAKTAPAAKTPPTTSNRVHKKTTPPPPLPPLPLADETLKAYTLSYGGAPTYAFSASSQSGDVVDYVTIVAQADANRELKIALDSETDSKHLDRTPRLRLVDVVDAQASNRASLLFELRAQNSRSFALYRVIGEQAEQIFSTGSTQ